MKILLFFLLFSLAKGNILIEYQVSRLNLFSQTKTKEIFFSENDFPISLLPQILSKVSFKYKLISREEKQKQLEDVWKDHFSMCILGKKDFDIPKFIFRIKEVVNTPDITPRELRMKLDQIDCPSNRFIPPIPHFYVRTSVVIKK